MNKLNFTSKNNGDVLNASEWNALVSKTDELVQAVNTGSASSGGSTPSVIDAGGVVSVNSKGNTTISAAKNINIEPAYVASGNSGTYGDVQIKPGDDITLESHHRSLNKRDEITIKTSNGQDGAAKAPVKLQVIASDITLSTKGKQVAAGSNDSANVMNVRVTDGTDKAYLKVRAQAIDLRSESHGGIALQPKGTDGQGNMNKIKFEHGGGDGLEFGTFNTEKTSIYTDEYRFKRDGVWKMATRTTEVSDKYDDSDETTHYKYVKAADDFYDNVSSSDETCTTKDIIKTAFAMNGGKDRHTKITNKGAIEIATNETYVIAIEETPADLAGVVDIDTISTEIAGLSSVSDGDVFNDGDFETIPTASTIYTNGTQYFSFTIVPAPSIKLDSGSELKLGGILDFGSSFNFGETDGGIETQYKLTKKNATKDCGILKVVGVNNHESNNLAVEGLVITPGQTATIAQCSLLDVIKLVNYMKNNNQGPWAE